MVLNPQFVVDGQGKRVKVILDVAEFEKLLEELEDLEDVRAYDRAKAEGGEAIPYEQARAEIEKNRVAEKNRS